MKFSSDWESGGLGPFHLNYLDPPLEAISQSWMLRLIILMRHCETLIVLDITKTEPNSRSFPSSRVPLFQSKSKCETIFMKITLNCMKMELYAELIFIRNVLHLDSFWNRGRRELGKGLLFYYTLNEKKTEVIFLFLHWQQATQRARTWHDYP